MVATRARMTHLTFLLDRTSCLYSHKCSKPFQITIDGHKVLLVSHTQFVKKYHKNFLICSNAINIPVLLLQIHVFIQCTLHSKQCTKWLVLPWSKEVNENTEITRTIQSSGVYVRKLLSIKPLLNHQKKIVVVCIKSHFVWKFSKNFPTGLLH